MGAAACVFRPLNATKVCDRRCGAVLIDQLALLIRALNMMPHICNRVLMQRKHEHAIRDLELEIGADMMTVHAITEHEENTMTTLFGGNVYTVRLGCAGTPASCPGRGRMRS